MRVVKISKFIADELKLDWLIDGLLPNIGGTLFYAPAGTGKTTFSVQMCLALQAGVPFLDKDTKQTNILYVQADSQAVEWQAMLRRIAPDGSDGFTVVDVPESCLGVPEYTKSLHEYVQMYNPGYIVYDSLYKLTAWPINNDQGIKLAVAMLLQIANGKPWMLIHHPPHDSSRAAGHHSLGAGMSNIWSLTRTMLKIEKGRLVKDDKILLSRDENGLWYPKKKKSEGDDNNVNSYISYSVLGR